MGKKTHDKRDVEKPFTPEPPQVMDPSKPPKKEDRNGKRTDQEKKKSTS